MLGSKPTFFMSLLNIISTQPIWMTSIHVFHGGRTMYPWVPGESMYTKVSHQISWTITSSLQPFVIPSHLHWENLWWARNSANPEISSVVQRRDMWREPSHQLWAQLWKKKYDKVEVSSSKSFWRQDPQEMCPEFLTQIPEAVLSSLPLRLTTAL